MAVGRRSSTCKGTKVSRAEFGEGCDSVGMNQTPRQGAWQLQMTVL